MKPLEFAPAWDKRNPCDGIPPALNEHKLGKAVSRNHMKSMKFQKVRFKRLDRLLSIVAAVTCVLVFTQGCSLEWHRPRFGNSFGLLSLSGKVKKTTEDITFLHKEWEMAAREAAEGKTPQAIERLHRLAQRFPDDSEIRLFLADLLLMEGKTEESLRLLKKVAEQAPHDGRVYYLLALAYDQAGQMEEALIHYEKALECEPDNEVYLASYEQAIIANGLEENSHF